jgi:hypothetical protein
VFFGLLSLLVVPVISIFNFASIGPVGFGAWIVMIALSFLADWLRKKIAGQPGDADLNPNDPTREDRA